MIIEFIKQHEVLLIWLTSVSIVTFFGTIAFIPVLLIRMSPDYFLSENRVPLRKRHHFFARLCLLIIKNIAGALFLIAGFVMLFIPGQGLLTILIGISLLNFPGKRKLERKLILHPKVLPVINSIRQKAGKHDLIIDNENKLWEE